MKNETKLKKAVLVTGASGQLGRKLVPRLVESGYRVRAHYRSEEKASRWLPDGAEPAFGDLCEPSWLTKAARDCHTVIHCAALVSLRTGRNELTRKINVDGTKAVIEACRKNNVKRLIYVSSIVTIGGSENGMPINEAAQFNLGNAGIPYIDSKKEAENLVLQANGVDLETIAVNPSIMISPPDREVTESDLKKIPSRLPFYFDFGINLVSADDVVSGIIAAIEKGKPGEKYLLTGDNIDQNKVFDLSEKYLGIKKPLIKLPYSMIYLLAVLSESYSKIRNKRPKIHRGMARLIKYKFYYSNQKAKRELGFEPKSIETVLDQIMISVEKK